MKIRQRKYVFFLCCFSLSLQCETKHIKQRKKASSTKKEPKEKKEPWGPTYYLDADMCAVVEGSVANSTEFTRSQVVSKLWDYIKKHGLQNQENKRNIDCDAKFKKIMDDNDTVTMFSMNKYITPHLKKTGRVIKRKAAPGGAKRKNKKKKKEGDEKATNNFPVCILSDELSAVCGGEKELRRSAVQKKIWEYIKSKELQNPENKKEIICDENLKKVFEVERISMFHMAKHFGRHMTKKEK